MEDNLKKLVEEKLNDITKEGLNLQDLQVVSELVDVHKDLCNEDYWKAKKEAMEMRYNRGYGEYDDYMIEEECPEQEEADTEEKKLWTICMMPIENILMVELKWIEAIIQLNQIL